MKVCSVVQMHILKPHPLVQHFTQVVEGIKVAQRCGEHL